MTNRLNICRASHHDALTIAPLFDLYRQFYGQKPNLEAAEQFLLKRLQNNESVIFFCTVEQVTVGFVQLYPCFSSVSLKQSWILNDLFVVPTMRKSGVGAALIRRAEQHASETQAKGLTLQTTKSNASAQRLYEQLGWQQETEFLTYNKTLTP